MKISKSRFSRLAIAVVVIGGAFILLQQFASRDDVKTLEVKVPELSQVALRGMQAYDDYCARCHGPSGAGSEQGPPLIHDVYNPGHHADVAFFFAAKRGVRAHHWRFGNMPPVPEAKDEDLAVIIRYVRELQTANGIFYKPHRM